MAMAVPDVPLPPALTECCTYTAGLLYMHHLEGVDKNIVTAIEICGMLVIPI